VAPFTRLFDQESLWLSFRCVIHYEYVLPRLRKQNGVYHLSFLWDLGSRVDLACVFFRFNTTPSNTLWTNIFPNRPLLATITLSLPDFFFPKLQMYFNSTCFHVLFACLVSVPLPNSFSPSPSNFFLCDYRMPVFCFE